MHVYTVGELQSEARVLLEENFGSVWVEGEISGFSVSSTGHAYFTLKDDVAQVSAVLWRTTLQRTRFDPEDGMAVRARGNLTIYERAGRYQFIVQRIEPLGAGPLQVRFEQMRARLEQEGLFDARHKQPLPRFARRAVFVTSPTGAALRDLVHVAQRRWPLLEIVVVPTRVQGDGAAQEIAEALGVADGLGADVIVCGRGGGSLEDLWAFNEEVVARAIFGARTPVVSAVGHEVDTSISDLVADLRAATPSAAAEAITPDRSEVARLLAQRRGRLGRALKVRLASAQARVAVARDARVFRRPFDWIRDRQQRLDGLAGDLARALEQVVVDRRRRVETHAARLDALSPLKVLARGYSVTRKDGRVVTRAETLATGDELETILHEGKVRSRVV